MMPKTKFKPMAFELMRTPTQDNSDARSFLDRNIDSSVRDWFWSYTYFKSNQKFSVFVIEDEDLAMTFTLMFSERIAAKGRVSQLPLQKSLL